MAKFTTDWTYIEPNVQEIDLLINFEYEKEQYNYPNKSDLSEKVYNLEFEVLAHTIFDEITAKPIELILDDDDKKELLDEFLDIYDKSLDLQEKIDKICLDAVHDQLHQEFISQ